jgi:hypothetical protein
VWIGGKGGRWEGGIYSTIGVLPLVYIRKPLLEEKMF